MWHRVLHDAVLLPSPYSKRAQAEVLSVSSIIYCCNNDSRVVANTHDTDREERSHPELIKEVLNTQLPLGKSMYRLDLFVSYDLTTWLDGYGTELVPFEVSLGKEIVIPPKEEQSNPSFSAAGSTEGEAIQTESSALQATILTEV